MIQEISPMNEEIRSTIEKCMGEPCTRTDVGRMKSLSLGFGDEDQRKRERHDKNYRLWEFGTYNCAWRIIRDGRVLCGSQDPADVAELDLIVGSIELGRFASILQMNELDIRVSFDNGVAIDFITTFSDDDECLHIFVPEHRCIKFSIRTGWKIGPSDKPWAAEA